ncbi:MAG: hypothetical protein GDA56_28455 [Hormoscilla sp. GM7CHS1pb]|nr:hypothetical protein [Hormoscilla sp. GM7CHS1pb]
MAVDCVAFLASDGRLAIGYQLMTYTGASSQSITGTNRGNCSKTSSSVPLTQPLINPESAALLIGTH